MTSFQIAIYGAALSTILALIKFWELWRDRLKISVAIGWNNLGPDITEVQITNSYKNPITIVWLELYWATHRRSTSKSKNIDLGMETGCRIELPAFSTKSLKFSEQYAFDPQTGKGNLYAKFSVAGRNSPIIVLAYKG